MSEESLWAFVTLLSLPRTAAPARKVEGALCCARAPRPLQR